MDKTTGIRFDHTVILSAVDSAIAHSDVLRSISYLDVETRKAFTFPTNHFTLPVLTIARIYKAAVEVSFKRIKQHMRLKPFWR